MNSSPLNRALTWAENPITALVGSARPLKLTTTKHNEGAGELVMSTEQVGAVILGLCLAAIAAQADSLELKNGSLTNGNMWAARRPRSAFK
jgi:hypothetical protein